MSDVEIKDNVDEAKSLSSRLCSTLLIAISYILIAVSFPVSIFFCIKIIQEYERALIFRLGRLISGKAFGPGIFFVIPCIDTYRVVDLRTVAFDVPPQEILTKDSVTVVTDAVVFYNVFNPVASIINVENVTSATRLLAATTLRNELGTKDLSDILLHREEVASKMQLAFDESTDAWGIQIQRIEIKDVRLPIQMQKSMSAVAEATRDARAKVIMAEGEEHAALSIKEAADIIGQSENALQLRFLQTLHSISQEKNSTVVVPIPVDFLKHIMKK
ncbi:Band 7 protein [Intoshia linei]|uniref:Band 7 protein n=1 Tax=Intoshia linei TaxID=1819745 RepID=A0A177BEJ2_9BILA|nr:Band 7 protein [Intoshia linei]